MRHAPIILLPLLVATACEATPQLDRATLTALRAVPMDSLTFGACNTIELDPSVRLVRSIVNLNPSAPIAGTLSFPLDSLPTHLPLRMRSWDPNEPPTTAAQVIVGLLDRPVPTTSDTLSFVVAVIGCRLAGSFVYVDTWRSGREYRAHVRGIDEG